MASPAYSFTVIEDEYPEVIAWLESHAKFTRSRAICDLISAAITNPNTPPQNQAAIDMSEIRAVLEAVLEEKLSAYTLAQATPQNNQPEADIDPMDAFNSLIG